MRRLLSPRVLGVTLAVLLIMVGSAVVLKVPLPGISLPAEPVACLGGHLVEAEHGLACSGGFPITNTLTGTLVVDLTIFLFMYFALRDKQLVPDGLQNALEAVIEWFYGLVEDVAGKENAPKFFPLVMTIFIFALVSNWWELVPGVDAFGWIVKAHGKGGWETKVLFGNVYTLVKEEGHHTLVPWLRTVTTDLNVTLAMAFISVTYVQIAGVQALGPGYFKKFIKPGYAGGIIDVFVGLLETISELARIISFSFRLFGNIFAGTVLLFVMPYLVPLFVPLPFYGLEIFVGLIQAFVFAVLTLVFISMAVVSHGEHEH